MMGELNPRYKRLKLTLLAVFLLSTFSAAYYLAQMSIRPSRVEASLPKQLITAQSPDWVVDIESHVAQKLFVPLALAQPTSTLTPTPKKSPTPTSTPVPTSSYYVDSVNGSDTNSGTSADNPWRTFAPVHSQAFPPGAVIHLRSGSTWDGPLRIDDSGTEGLPILFTAYDTGPKPVIRGSGNSSERCIDVRSDWIVVDGLMLQRSAAYGVQVREAAQHIVVRNCEITDVGIGVAVYGQYNLVTNNYIHDLHMVVNTSGGDNDYGAVGAWLFSTNNEVAYNTFRNCRSPSYDYGVDGGAVEFFGTVNNSYVHHNWVEDCAGFLEVGGNSQGREAKDIRVAYNILINNTRALLFNLGAYQYASDVSNFHFENNTVVESTPWETAINFVQGALTGNQLILRNNVFQGFYKLARTIASDGNESPSTAFAHEYNIYQGIGQSFSLGAGEIFGNPLFVDLAAKNLTLQAISPAIDGGLNLGYSLDFCNHIVPFGVAPDLGAYEYYPPK